MEIALSPLNAMASPPPTMSHDQKTHIPPFYYSLVAIASIAMLLVAYNLFIVGWCWRNQRDRRQNQSLGTGNTSSSRGMEQLIPICKYRKEDTKLQACSECAVCLSVFVDGEDLRQLPKCKHSFHADCIDMWLYSHSNCPLCREAVAVPPRHPPLAREEFHFIQGLPL